jgi:stearoyl-CoA desaturase (Delta-9 desaturase)
MNAPTSAVSTAMHGTVAPPPFSSADQPQYRHIVDNKRLKKIQHRHTVAMTGLGASGFAVAIALHLFVQSVSGPALSIFALFFFCVGMGLTIGYHRHFTHKSYKARTSFRVLLGILGSMAGQGPIVFWTSLHRMHHELADKAGDPHSPNLHGEGLLNRLRGIAHAYIGWTVKHEVPNANFYARDLLADAPIMWVNKRYYVWIAGGWLLPAVLGAACTGTAYGALEGFLWGGLARMFVHHNMIWWITSFAHVIGRRDYAARDLSTNNAWLAIPTLGESWHNNHHAFPRAAVLSLHWWQLDISGLVVTVLEKLGIVSEVCRVLPQDRDRRATATPDAA